MSGNIRGTEISWILQQISVLRKYNHECASSLSLIMILWKGYHEIKAVKITLSFFRKNFMPHKLRYSQIQWSLNIS